MIWIQKLLIKKKLFKDKLRNRKEKINFFKIKIRLRTKKLHSKKSQENLGIKLETLFNSKNWQT